MVTDFGFWSGRVKERAVCRRARGLEKEYLSVDGKVACTTIFLLHSLLTFQSTLFTSYLLARYFALDFPLFFLPLSQ